MISRSTSINPTELTTEQTNTIETTTKSCGNVLNRKDATPNEAEDRKILFAFATIKNLLALLAGAALAAVLLVSLVYHLKK